MNYFCSYHRRIKRQGGLWKQMKVDDVFEVTGKEKEDGYSDVRCDWCQDKDDDRVPTLQTLATNIIDVFDINRVRDQEFVDESSEMLCFHYSVS